MKIQVMFYLELSHGCHFKTDWPGGWGIWLLNRCKEKQQLIQSNTKDWGVGSKQCYNLEAAQFTQ